MSNEFRGLEVAALFAGAGLITYRLARGGAGAIDAARASEEPSDVPGRRLYLSLDGVERTEWKASVALLAAGLFGAGVLVGRISTGDRKS